MWESQSPVASQANEKIYWKTFKEELTLHFQHPHKIHARKCDKQILKISTSTNNEGQNRLSAKDWYACQSEHL